MEKVFYNVKARMTFDGDMQCSYCYCTVGGGKKESNKSNTKHVVCAQSCPAIINITKLICDFLDDDLC